jgi:hypothetical protein
MEIDWPWVMKIDASLSVAGSTIEALGAENELMGSKTK